MTRTATLNVGHVIGELCSFITVFCNQGKNVEYQHYRQQGKILLAFFDERMLYEHSIASSKFWRCPSFHGFTLLPYKATTDFGGCRCLSRNIFTHNMTDLVLNNDIFDPIK